MIMKIGMRFQNILFSLVLLLTLVAGIGLAAADEVTLTLEGITDGPLPNNAMDVYISGNYAYVADYTNGLVIVDVSDPTNPTTVGNFPSRIGDFGYTAAAISVAVSGNYAYVGNWYDDLYIIDITDKTNPTLANTYPAEDGVDEITISENLGFLAAEWAGMDIIDISDPVNPVFIGNYNTDDLAEDVAIQNNYAYIADRDDGVIIVDISDLANPSFVGSVDTPFDANSIEVSGKYAYVADAGETLIIDVTDSANPSIVANYPTIDSWGIALDSDYVYVGDGDNGVIVLNVNDPNNPILAGSYDTTGYAGRLNLIGDLLYVADGPLIILQVITPNSNILFKCKSGEGFTDFDKDYTNVFQICPAHDNNFDKTDRITTGPLYIVIHNTGGGTTQSNINLFQKKSRRASAHYLVGPDSNGEIRVIQMVSEKNNAWHADHIRRPLYEKDIFSKNSIGIEIVGHSGDPDWPTEEIYNTIVDLVNDIVQRNEEAGREIELTRRYIVGHEEINKKGKWDPGPNWDWKRFIEMDLGGTYEPSISLTATYEPSLKQVNLQINARSNGRDGFKIERSENGGQYEEVKKLRNVARLLSDNPATIEFIDRPPERAVATEYSYRVWAYVNKNRMWNKELAVYVDPSNEATVNVSP